MQRRVGVSRFIEVMFICVAMLIIFSRNVLAVDCSYVTRVWNNSEKRIVESVNSVDAAEVTSSDDKWITGWYVASGNVTINNRVTVEGTVNLILSSDCNLTVTGGIEVIGENTINIYGYDKDDSGKLIANGTVDGDAAIGGSYGKACGTITINGGTVIATASADNSNVNAAGAGIGNGGGYVVDGEQCIIINGGNVSATGGNSSTYGAAGIGSGGNNTKATGGVITINAGTVNSSGGAGTDGGGAGIGIGAKTEPDVIESVSINGGIINAVGAANGATGIGGGTDSEIGGILISGGYISATGTAKGAAAAVAIGNGAGKSIYSVQPNNAIIVDETTKKATAYGDPVINENLTLENGYELTIGENQTLTINAELTNNGTIINNGTITGNGLLINTNGELINNGEITSKVEYTITYELYGGTINSGNVTKYHTGVVTTLPTDVTKEDYRFAGWYQTSDFSDDAVTSIKDTDTGNKKFYAKYEEKGLEQVTINTETQTFDYDKSGKEFIIKGNNAVGNFKIEYSGDNTGWTENKPVNAGTYQVRVTRPKDTDYESYSNENLELVINPLAVVVEWTTPANLVYDGSDKEVQATVENVIDGDQVTLTLTDFKQVNAGNYTTEVIELDNSNYTLVNGQNLTKDWEITKAETQVESLKIYSGDTETNTFTYGNVITLKIKIKPTQLENLANSEESANTMALYYNGEKISENVKVDNNGIYTINYDTTDRKVPVGNSINLVVKYIGNSNAKDCEKEFAIALSKANSEIGTLPSVLENLVYTGNAQNLIMPGSNVSGGTLKYRVNEATDYSENVPAKVDAGEYDIYYKVFGDDYHNDTNEFNLGKVKIAEKTINTTINLTAPVAKATPETQIETEEYTAVVAWSPEVTETFEYAKEYTAVVTITPKTNYTVKGISENSYILSGAKTVVNDKDSNVITITYPATEAEPAVKPNNKPSSSGGGNSTLSYYTIKFEENGGSKIKEQSVKKNKLVTKPIDPTRDGYIFGGWYTSKDLKEEYDFNTKVTKQFTLYAKWIEQKGWKNPFVDVKENDWFYEAVKYVSENEMFKGTSETTFGPNEPMTRAMLVTVLWRLENEPKVDYAMQFKDVDDATYYTEAVRWAASEKLVIGMSVDEFNPDGLITREQIATILYRYSQFKKFDVSVGEDTNILSYEDFNEISEYAIPALQWSAGAGIMTGRTESTITPKSFTTRAEVATMMMRLSLIIK